MREAMYVFIYLRLFYFIYDMNHLQVTVCSLYFNNYQIIGELFMKKEEIKMVELIQFNETIQVELDLNQVTDMLVQVFDPAFKHIPLVANAIMGNLSKNPRTVGDLYHALLGFSNEIDFVVGDIVECNETYYYEGDYVPYGRCKVIDIDLYSDHKLRVEYERKRKDKEEGIKVENSTSWVRHTTCNRLASSKKPAKA